MNWRAVWAIYRTEMARMFRTLLQSLVAVYLSGVKETMNAFGLERCAKFLRIDEIVLDGVARP